MYIISKGSVYRVIGNTAVKDTVFLKEKRVYIDMLDKFNKIASSRDVETKQRLKVELKGLHDGFNEEFGDINSDKHEGWVQLDSRSTFLEVLTPQYYLVTAGMDVIKGQFDLRTAIQESWKKYKRVDEETLGQFLSVEELSTFDVFKGEYLRYLPEEGIYIPKVVFNSNPRYAKMRLEERIKRLEARRVGVVKLGDLQRGAIVGRMLGDWEYDKGEWLDGLGVLEKFNMAIEWKNYGNGSLRGIEFDNTAKELKVKGESIRSSGAIIYGIALAKVLNLHGRDKYGSGSQEITGERLGLVTLEVFENWVYGKGSGHDIGVEFERDFLVGILPKIRGEVKNKSQGSREVGIYLESREGELPDPESYKYFNFDKGMNTNVAPYESQYRAAVRVLESEKSQILNHGVGSGKTWTAAIASIEGKRQGYFKRPAYVVPHLLISQTRDDILTLYPDAKIYVMQTALLQKPDWVGRLEGLFECNNYDMILMSTAQFRRVGVPRMEVRRIVLSDIVLYKEALEAELGRVFAPDIVGLEDSLRYHRGCSVDIKGLGVDKFFIDEAHEYFDQRILGRLARNEGVRGRIRMDALDFYYKTRYIAEYTQNKGIVLMTGSPVDKNLATMYVIETLLDFEGLKGRGEILYDSWARNYHNGEGIEAKLVYGGDVGVSRAREFSDRQVNRINILMDTVSTLESQEGLPDYEVINEVTGTSEGQNDLIESVRDASGVTVGALGLGYGRCARSIAIHEGIVVPELAGKGLQTSKRVEKLVDNVMRHYGSPSIGNTAQIILCDVGAPRHVDSYNKDNEMVDGKLYFNLYKHIKCILVSKGIPEEEIAFISDATTGKKKLKLFKGINEAVVRVILGGTRTLGTGANIQERLEVLHNLDIVSNNSKFEQRVGRIVRKGNLNPKVIIYNYISNQEADIVAVNNLISQRNASEMVFKATTGEGGALLEVFDYKEMIGVAEPKISKLLELIEGYSRNANKVGELKIRLSKYLGELDVLKHSLGKCRGIVELGDIILQDRGVSKEYKGILDVVVREEVSVELNRVVNKRGVGEVGIIFNSTERYEFVFKFNKDRGELRTVGELGERVVYIYPYNSDTNVIDIAMGMLSALDKKSKTLVSGMELYKQACDEYKGVVERANDALDKMVEVDAGVLIGHVGEGYGHGVDGGKGNKVRLREGFLLVGFGVGIYSRFIARLERGGLIVRDRDRVLNDGEIRDLLVLGAYYGRVATGITHMGLFEVLRENGEKLARLGFGYMQQVGMLPASYKASLGGLEGVGLIMKDLPFEQISLGSTSESLGIGFREAMAVVIYGCKIARNKGGELSGREEHILNFKKFLKGYPFKVESERIMGLSDNELINYLKAVKVLDEDDFMDVGGGLGVTKGDIKEVIGEVTKDRTGGIIEVRGDNEYWKTEIKEFAGYIYKVVKSFNDATQGNATYHKVPIFIGGNEIKLIKVPAIDAERRQAYSMSVIVKMAYSKGVKDIKTGMSIRLASLFLKGYALTRPKTQLEFTEYSYSIANARSKEIGIEIKERVFKDGGEVNDIKM
jgi:hypothetical protein